MFMLLVNIDYGGSWSFYIALKIDYDIVQTCIQNIGLDITCDALNLASKFKQFQCIYFWFGVKIAYKSATLIRLIQSLKISKEQIIRIKLFISVYFITNCGRLAIFNTVLIKQLRKTVYFTLEIKFLLFSLHFSLKNKIIFVIFHEIWHSKILVLL